MPVTLTWLATATRTEMSGGDTVDATFEKVILDGTVSETYDGEATATEHPIEDGADITDHVRPGLQRLTLDVVVSAHPGPGSPAQADLTGWTGTARDNPAARPAVVRALLARLRDEGTEVDVETGIGAWESMLILTISEARSSERGDGFRATVTFREFRRVSTGEVAAPSPRVERGRRRRDRGDQPTAEPSPMSRVADAIDRIRSGDTSAALEILREFDPGTWGGS